jgi:DNA-binding winged helix-turn-helix (wHTH) protein
VNTGAVTEAHQALQHTVYFFDGFQLDVTRRKLVSSGGLVQSLNSRAMDALLLLVANAGELVEKRRLMQTVWPNAIVEDNNLNQCILAIRKALGETAGSNRYIMTVQGRGYRFVCPVRAVEQEALGDTAQVSAIARHPAPALWLGLTGAACIALAVVVAWLMSPQGSPQRSEARVIPGLDPSASTLVVQLQESQAADDDNSAPISASTLAQCMAARPDLKLRVRVELLDERGEVWASSYGAGISEPRSSPGIDKGTACRDLLQVTR